VKDNCALFAPTPYFQVRAIRWFRYNFFPADPCCLGNEFWDKIDYNSAPAKETQLLGYIAWQWDRYLVPQNVFLVFYINLSFALWITLLESGLTDKRKRTQVISVGSNPCKNRVAMWRSYSRDAIPLWRETGRLRIFQHISAQRKAKLEIRLVCNMTKTNSLLVF